MSSQILKYPRNLSGTYRHVHDLNATQKMKFSIRNFFCKCNQICRFQRIWSHLLKKSFTENFIFCIVKCSWDFHMTLGISSEYTVNFLISLSAYCKNVVHAQTLRISPYSVWMRENTDQKNSVFGHFSCSDVYNCIKRLKFTQCSRSKTLHKKIKFPIKSFFIFFCAMYLQIGIQNWLALSFLY